MTYEVHAPARQAAARKSSSRDEIPGTVKYTTDPGADNTLVHRWEVTNVPRMFDEPAMPPYENVLQRVLVSTTPDWQDVSKWYWNLSKPHLDATSPEMKKTVADLTAERQDRHGQDQGALLLRLAKGPLHGPDPGEGPARLRAARCLP